MTNTNKQRGDAFERAVAESLRANGLTHAQRMLRLGAHTDRGDIEGVPGFHIDCKAHARFALNEWVDEVVREAPRGHVPVVVVKRPRAHTNRAYVVIELATFARLISR